ncbi:MAG: hypothetical protein IJM10_03515 [Clostridia bacterium]|nr:hypothetical protein [Clostridia bacterium]
MNRKGTVTDANKFGFLPCAHAKTNALSLQKAINEYETVCVSEPGVYDVSGTIRLPSDTRLVFSQGVTLRRVPLENRLEEGNLFVNEGAFDGTYNENIRVEGAHIVVNGVESAAISSDGDSCDIARTPNAVTGLRGQMAFLYVRRLRIDGVVITDLSSKDYGIQVSDFEDVVIENIHIEGKKDGVHFGPGKSFVLRNARFRTGDDAIALNCADYSVSNPNFGSISDGLIENCVELPGAESSLFIRILAGTARDWKKGMEVYHSDAVRTKNGMYRVVMRPDNKKYISETEPCFDETCKELDGIFWVKTHKGYEAGNIPLEAGCRNITFRNIRLENPRELAALIYMNNDGYLRSFHPGSAVAQINNIRFENVQVLKPVKRFLSVEMPARNIVIEGGNIGKNNVVIKENNLL